MRLFEQIHLMVSPMITTPWNAQVQSEFRDIVDSYLTTIEVLDIGGRKSPYTIGLNASVTISDIPRETILQEELKSGGYFVMTTPNSGVVPNNNPDHKRHYIRPQLVELLSKYFDPVNEFFSTRRGGWILYFALRSPSRFWFAAPLIFSYRLISHARSKTRYLRTAEDKAEKRFVVAQKQVV